MEDTGLDGKVKELLDKGFKELEGKEFDKAIDTFESVIDNDRHISYYGLATAIFRKAGISASLEELDRIALLYESCLELKPDYADAHLMLGLANMQRSSQLIKQFKTKRNTNILKVASDYLSQAEDNLKNAKGYNPGFCWTVDENLKIIELKKQAIQSFKA